MRITVMIAGEKITTLDVDSHETVEDVKALLEVESNVPIQQQQLLYNGNEMRNSDKLSAFGVKDDDLLMMLPNASTGKSPLQALLYADPFDVEQKKIEAAVRQIMLYVDMEVNGVPLKAFVDSNAQSTIISKSCAERCGLLKLMDQRYKGIAHGVGQSEILGRIHVAPIKIGNNFYPCSFVVLDSPNMEFLFGLDMLRKHQCTIDLKDNVLTVGGGEVSVPFLQEKDLPSRFLNEERVPNQASSSRAAVPFGFRKKKNNTVAWPARQPPRQHTWEGPEKPRLQSLWS